MIKNDFAWLVNEIPGPTRLPVFQSACNPRNVARRSTGRDTAYFSEGHRPTEYCSQCMDLNATNTSGVGVPTPHALLNFLPLYHNLLIYVFFI